MKKVKTSELIIPRYNDNVFKLDDDEHFFYDRDERKLFETLQSFQNGNVTHVMWISIRNQCIDLICLKGSLEFFIKFMSVMKIDPKYYEENYEFFKYLHQLTIWRDNKSKNTEMLIDNLCELYINHYTNDELLNRINIIVQV